MSIIYMIRHGQTDWNAERRLQGQKDIGLNALGESQAHANGLALKALLGDRVAEFDFVSSPLTRTRDTMQRARAAMGLDPMAYRTDARLVEISFGDWEGRTIPELKITDRPRLDARKAAKWDFIPPGENAESYEILSWRTGSWLQSVDKPTVCVSHGGVIRTLFKLIAGVGLEEAANQDIPQDRVLQIDREAGTVVWL